MRLFKRNQPSTKESDVASPTKSNQQRGCLGFLSRKKEPELPPPIEPDIPSKPEKKAGFFSRKPKKITDKTETVITTLTRKRMLLNISVYLFIIVLICGFFFNLDIVTPYTKQIISSWLSQTDSTQKTVEQYREIMDGLSNEITTQQRAAVVARQTVVMQLAHQTAAEAAQTTRVAIAQLQATEVNDARTNDMEIQGDRTATAYIDAQTATMVSVERTATTVYIDDSAARAMAMRSIEATQVAQAGQLAQAKRDADAQTLPSSNPSRQTTGNCTSAAFIIFVMFSVVLAHRKSYPT